MVDRLWTKFYPKQTVVISCCDETNVLTVDLEDGKIFLYKVKKDMNFTQLNEGLEIKPQNERIIGILSRLNIILYSLSTDNKLSVALIEYIDNISRINITL